MSTIGFSAWCASSRCARSRRTSASGTAGRRWIRQSFAAWGSSGSSVSACRSSWGGQGMDYISLGLACEELEAVDTSLRVVMSVHLGLNSLGLLQWATDEQIGRLTWSRRRGREAGRVLPDRARRGLGRRRAGGQRAAQRIGDYVLNGEKMWISLASAGRSLPVVRANEFRGRRSSRRPERLRARGRPAGRHPRRHPRQTRDPRRLHGLGALPGCPPSGCLPSGRRGRRVPHRHVLPGRRALHRGRRRHRV